MHTNKRLGLSCLICAAHLVLARPCASQAATGIGPSFKGPVGLQLYSLREQFQKDVPGTLDKVKGFGVKYAELAGAYNVPPEKFKAELQARGILAISGHFPFKRFREDPEGVAQEARILGLKYAGCAWIDHSGDFDEKTCREAAK